MFDFKDVRSQRMSEFEAKGRWIYIEERGLCRYGHYKNKKKITFSSSKSVYNLEDF